MSSKIQFLQGNKNFENLIKKETFFFTIEVNCKTHTQKSQYFSPVHNNWASETKHRIHLNPDRLKASYIVKWLKENWWAEVAAKLVVHLTSMYNGSEVKSLHHKTKRKQNCLFFTLNSLLFTGQQIQKYLAYFGNKKQAFFFFFCKLVCLTRCLVWNSFKCVALGNWHSGYRPVRPGTHREPSASAYQSVENKGMRCHAWIISQVLIKKTVEASHHFFCFKWGFHIFHRSQKLRKPLELWSWHIPSYTSGCRLQ